jgi:hypothetical protein
MRFRWTKKELDNIDDFNFLEKLCIERQSDCTNINAPLYKKLAEVRARLHIRIEEQQKPRKKLIGYQPAAEEFPIAGLQSFEVYENLGMGARCHPGVKSWIPIFEGMIEKPVMIPYVAAYGDEEKEEEDTNYHIRILSHDISYFFRDTDLHMDDCVQEHVCYLITQDCTEGDLTMTDPNNPDIEYFGYWRINTK